MRARYGFFIILLLFSFPGNAAIQVPKNLRQGDREEAVRILGFGTSTKILSDPYPLGGYAGFELGVAIETLTVQDLGRLGSTLSSPQQDVSYPKFSVGKGVYGGFDFFLSFIPYSQKNEISQYGGILRWGFLQGRYLPYSLSLALNATNTTFSNRVITTSTGLDLMAGINVDKVSLFGGAGPVYASGRFIGGSEGVTDSGYDEFESVHGMHIVLGINVHISDLFVAFQLDRYTQSVISGKLGLRF